MAGLDKIIDQIMEEARGQAQDIVKEAEGEGAGRFWKKRRQE